jgi:hypothetical protein
MDALPASIGPYRVLSAIGRGGMGVVYRAQHRDTGTLAAVKTLLLRDRSNLQSLRREIRALAGLSHPGVAHILDDGVESGRPWFAMELHSGPSLRALIDEAVTWEQQLAVLGVLRRLCAPLAFLHGEGLVHRDLKPENIVVGERPVIVDFGLAAQFEGRLSLALLPDGTRGQGTLRYLAPELLSGDPVDARADLYALGCILYELCARQPPFDGSLAAIARGHLDEQPLPLATLAPRLPRELHVLVGRLLAKRPRDRLGHAQDVAAALAACGAAGEIDPVPPRAYVYRPGLAGRGDALESLRAVLRAPRSGVGRLALVAGESGVGKTRLLAEVIREAQERRLTVLMGECQHQASAPLEALRRPLQAIADSCRDRDAEEVDRVFGERGRILALYVPEVLELAGQERHPDPPTLPPRQAEERLLTSLARTFAAFAADRPMLLVLDDLQWADDLTLSFLRHLPVERLSVIASYRSEEMRPEIAALAQSALCVRLERLGDAEVVAMVGDMLAVSPAPPLLGRYLCRQSEGNPFFVAEYLRLAVGEGLLARDAAGSWKFPEQMDAYEALPLPRSLRDLLERRLSGLGEAADAVSAAAAVVDRELDAALIAEMTGLGQPELFRALNELLRRQILDDIGLGRVRFQHAKLREVAYAALGEARAGELHRRAAAAIEASLSREPDPVKREALADEAAAALALHQQRSGQWLPAVHSNRRAARRSMAALARGEALAHLERARDILAKLPETPELLALTIDTLNHAYAARMQLTSAADDANLQMSRAMVPIAERLGDPLWLSTVHANLARSSFTRGDLESCLRHGRLSLAWAEKSGVLSRIAAGSYILAGGCVQAGRMSELLELAPRFREVLELLESSGATQSPIRRSYLSPIFSPGDTRWLEGAPRRRRCSLARWRSQSRAVTDTLRRSRTRTGPGAYSTTATARPAPPTAKRGCGWRASTIFRRRR